MERRGVSRAKPSAGHRRVDLRREPRERVASSTPAHTHARLVERRKRAEPRGPELERRDAAHHLASASRDARRPRRRASSRGTSASRDSSPARPTCIVDAGVLRAPRERLGARRRARSRSATETRTPTNSRLPQRSASIASHRRPSQRPPRGERADLIARARPVDLLRGRRRAASREREPHRARPASPACHRRGRRCR